MNEAEKKELGDYIAARVASCTKEVLTVEDVAFITGLSVCHIHRLTSDRIIPFYKPNGKTCYFNRKEVEAWMQSNRRPTRAELNERAAAYSN